METEGEVDYILSQVMRAASSSGLKCKQFENFHKYHKGEARITGTLRQN